MQDASSQLSIQARRCPRIDIDKASRGESFFLYQLADLSLLQSRVILKKGV